MRRATTAAAPAAAAASALRLPLEYIAACVGVPTSALLSLEQTTAERVFSTLLSRLSLPHVSALVASRVSERQDAKSAAKVGSALLGSAAAAVAAEEASYRSVFTRLIVQQAQALGFKGAVAPALHSLVMDRKLALRIMDFLTDKAFGPPDDTQAGEANGEGSQGGRRGHSAAAPASSQRAPADDKSGAPARRMRNADHDDAIDPPRRRAAAGPASADAPPRRGGAVPISDPRTAQLPPQQLQQAPVRGARRVIERSAAAAEESDGDEEEEDHPDDREDTRSHRPLRPAAHESSSSFDGRFADEEFGSAPAPARSGRSTAAAPPSSRSMPGNRRPATSSSSSSVSDADKNREELLAELQAERARHSATSAQLHSVRGMFDQLLRERGEEQFGARRVTLLKAQNLQMERQISLLSASSESRRQALHEIGTVVGGLADSVHEAQQHDGDSVAVGPKTSRRLAQLERSIEAAQQRLSRQYRPELQFSSSEERFLAAGASMSAASLYSGELTHLDLSRVHALESNLADLHERLRAAHSALTQLAAHSPMQTQVDDLPALLDSVRSCAFDLQSLGVLLPSSSAFAHAHPSAPAGSDREWRWLQSIRSALQRRGASAASLDALMKRAEREESLSAIKCAMLREEVAHYRRVATQLTSAVVRFVSESDRIVDRWRTDNNALYADVSAELSTVVRDWQRNPTQVSVQKLLTLLQGALPCLRQLLEFKQKRVGHSSARDADFEDAAGSPSSSGLPPIAAELQAALSDEQARLQSAMEDMRQQQRDVEATEQIDAEQSELRSNLRAQPSRPASRADHLAAAAASASSISSGRRTHRGGSGGSSSTPPAELPPFQF